MEEFTFPIEDVSNDLLDFVFEKMFYQVFRKFNLCSKSSAEMCEILSSSVRLQADVFYIAINKGRYVFLTDVLKNKKQGISIDSISFNLNFNTTTMSVNIEEPESFHIFLKRHKVKTDSLKLEGDITDENLDFVQFLLKATDAKKLESGERTWVSRDICISEAFFGLPEVQKLQLIFCVPAAVTDSMILNLLIPNITLSKNRRIISEGHLPLNDITENGIYRFLMQWVRRERRIELLSLERALTFDLESIIDRIEETSNVKVFRIRDRRNQTTSFSICRKEKPHKECLYVQLFCNNHLNIKACEQSYLCPGTLMFR